MNDSINLKLTAHLMPDNEGVMIFESARETLRINRLSNVLQFIATLKQLTKAIDLGGKQDCYHELINWKGLQWVLNCTFKRELVGLEIWYQKRGFSEQLKTGFNWQGKAGEFRDAVNGMIGSMGRYLFFKKY
ncbi:hypothetical protein ACVWYN_000042 [Pedobacter sp. UYP24]